MRKAAYCCTSADTNSHAKYPHKIHFSTVPNRKPNKEPIPDFNAWRVSLPPRSSPINAPKNGPRTMPQGMKNSPMIVHARHPRVQQRVPQLYLLNSMGMK